MVEKEIMERDRVASISRGQVEVRKRDVGGEKIPADLSVSPSDVSDRQTGIIKIDRLGLESAGLFISYIELYIQCFSRR